MKKNPLTFSYKNLLKWIYVNIEKYKGDDILMTEAAIEYFNMEHRFYTLTYYNAILIIISYYTNVWHKLSKYSKLKRQQIWREKILENSKPLYNLINEEQSGMYPYQRTEILIWWFRIDQNAFENSPRMLKKIQSGGGI